MKQAGLTLQERQMVLVLKWWLVIFAAAAIGFAVFPTEIISGLNIIGHHFFRWPAPSLAEPSEHFWQILAVSLLFVLTYVSYITQRDIRQNLIYVPLIILAKFVTAAGFLLAFILDGHHFAYFAGMVIDAIIFFITWYCYQRANGSRVI